MVKISVIVPVYNTEEYLEKCLQSLVNQTLKDIEIICVNDGSTDNSAKILKQYAKNYPHIKVIEQQNLKQGAARNKGVKAAQGEYIGYVDSDDWIDNDYFEKLYLTAKKYDSDIALATNIRIGNGKTKKRLDIHKEGIYSSLQNKLDVCKQSKNECPTNKIYRREFLEKNDIVWPEGVYCEDKIYTLKAVYYANSVVTVPDVNYYYYRRTNSTVKQKNNHNADKNYARRQVLDFLKEHNAKIRDCEFWAIKSEKKIMGVTLWKIKESLRTEKHYLFGIIPCLIKSC